MTSETLIDRYLRDECSADELAEFQTRLENDAEFGELFVQTTTEIAQIIEVAEEVCQNTPANRSTVAKPAPVNRILLFGLVAAAAAVLVIFVLPQPASQPIAILSRSVAAQWPAGVNRPLGATLTAGNFRLDKGFAELSFNNGPRLIIEGPASLELVDNKHARLLSGRLVARIPEQAIGFKIDTPDAQAIDLGTEFGMFVDKAAGTEIHVIEGIVDVNAYQKGKTKRLTTSQALKVSAQSSSETTASPDAFMRILPPQGPLIPPFVHWSFDDIDGTKVPDEGSGIDDRHYDARLASIKGAKQPAVVDGMIGQALYFDGTGNFVETDFPGISDSSSRTVAFWVKVPKNANPKHAYAMLSWGSFKHHGATWQISWNSEPNHGPLGRLRAGVHGGQVIGSQDLRDGRWHHVAIVLFGGDSADIATHVLLYVDGELENTSRKSIQAIKTDISPDAKTVHMGRNAGFDHKNRFFRGFIDDVIISNEALSHDQIQSIMQIGGSSLKKGN